jgi:hypothetical protein
MERNVMNRFILTSTTAALLAGASTLPAFAEGHMDLSTMRCSEFRALDQEQQVEVARMAINELEGGGESMLDTATATEPSGGGTDENSADDGPEGTLVENDGTATATDGEEDVDRESAFEADMEALFAACDRNLQATVLDAAAGMDTNR